MKKPKKIEVFGRRWFQKSYGNTYHVANVFVDGVRVDAGPMQYGYGDQYLTTAREALQKAGYLPGIEKHAHGGYEHLRIYCERKGICFCYSALDVPRERDLTRWP